MGYIFYILLFFGIFILSEIVSFYFRIFRYKESFLESSFYIRSLNSHILQAIFCLLLVILIFFVETKSKDFDHRKSVSKTTRILSCFYFSTALITVAANFSSEVLDRLGFLPISWGMSCFCFVVAVVLLSIKNFRTTS